MKTTTVVTAICALLAGACGGAVESEATATRADALEIGRAVARAPAVQAEERHWRCSVADNRREDASLPWQLLEYELDATTTLGVGVAVLDLGPNPLPPATACSIHFATAAAAITLQAPAACSGAFEYEQGTMWPASDVLRASLDYRFTAQGAPPLQGEGTQTFTCTWIDG